MLTHVEFAYLRRLNANTQRLTNHATTVLKLTAHVLVWLLSTYFGIWVESIRRLRKTIII